MENGRAGTVEFAVTEQDTAVALGSGDLPVLATPRLLAWMEAATCAAIAGMLPPGRTSVGTRVAVEHLAASPMGSRVSVTATVDHLDGRLVRFAVVASAVPEGTVLGHGDITRVVVDRERFLARHRSASG
jgi:fluoroacetyl-CoA thioesterase